MPARGMYALWEIGDIIMTTAARQDSHDKNTNIPSSLQRERGPNIHERVQRLFNEMKVSVESKQPINLSNPPHREITEALHGIVYYKNDVSRELEITYNDVSWNSGRKRFPVYCLELPRVWPDWQKPEIKKRTINIGTLSFRHVSYDDFVDFYLIRDRETRALNSYEIQDLAYERMTSILNDAALKGESYISLFQTGLEPLVVGAYLAIVEQIRLRSDGSLPQLFVKPVFFADSKKGEDLGSRKYWG